MELNTSELQALNGAGINITWGILLGGGITFLIGLFDGIFRPFKCR